MPGPGYTSGSPGAHRGDHIIIGSQYIEHDSMSHDTRRVLVNLIARYYAGQVRGYTPNWTAEGIAAIVEVGLGYRSPDWVPESREFNASNQQVHCQVDNVIELSRTLDAACHGQFGARFFLDLYRTLGEAQFRDGFARLIAAVNGRYPLYSKCWPAQPLLGVPCLLPQSPPFEKAFTDAFAFGLPPGSRSQRQVVDSTAVARRLETLPCPVALWASHCSGCRRKPR